MGRKIQNLRTLKDFDSLSDSEYKEWRSSNAQYLPKNSTLKQERELYNADRFAQRFGADKVRMYTPAQRLAIEQEELEKYNNSLIQKDYYDTRYPLRDDGSLDPNKGMGNLETYYKYGLMEPKFIKELQESDWLAEPELNAKIKKKQDDTFSYYSDPRVAGTEAGAAGALSYFSWGKDAEEKIDRGSNKNIIDKIYARDMAFKAKKVAPLVDEAHQQLLSLKDVPLKQEFLKTITPIKGEYAGIPQLAAFYDENGNIKSDEVEKLGADEMRRWIAKAKVYSAHYEPGTVYDMLDKEAKDYINDHQDWIEYSQALANDMAIGASAYTADKINGVRAAFLSLKNNKVPAYRDDDGHYWGKEHVKDGIYTDPYSGEKIPVKLDYTTEAVLDAQGIAPDGTTRGAFFNNKYWSDAEATGTFDRKEQARAKELNGYSPTKAVYKLGEDKDYLWEVAKMAQFAAADAMSTLVPVGGAVGMLGKGISSGGKFAQAIIGVGRVSNALKTTGAVVTKAAPVVSQATLSTLSAVGIGHAYGRNEFSETLEGNMSKIENSLHNEAENRFHEDYNSNSDFKDEIDFKVDELANSTLSQYGEQLDNLSGEELQQLISSIREQAQRKVVQDYIEDDIKNTKKTPEYDKLVNKAAEEATSAALTAAWTTGLKYSLVNNFTFRSYLFKDPLKRVNSAMKDTFKKITEGANGRLSIKVLEDAAKGIKVKEVGKIIGSGAWNGAWTNFTDELQSAGARRINDDRMARYLSGDYAANAQAELLGGMSNVLSYLGGMNSSLSDSSTWNAGLVGALGSITSIAPNVHGIFKLATNKEARAELSKLKAEHKYGEIANMFITNGILNTYFDKVIGERQAKQVIDQINDILDSYEDFKVLERGLALDMASIDATNPHDIDALEFVKAAKTMQFLLNFSNDKSNKELMGAAQRSSIFQNALETIDKIVNNNFTYEDAKEYLAEYYSRNPSVMQSEENNLAALEVITSNAQKLKTGLEVVNKVEEAISNAEKRGVKVSPLVRASLVERFALDQFLGDRIAEVEESISGSRAVTAGTTIESFGNDKAIGSRIGDLSKIDSKLSTAIDRAIKEKAKADKRLTDYKESKRDVETGEYLLTQDEQNELILLQAEADAAAMQVRALEEQKRSVSVEKDKLMEMRDSQSEKRILSSDEILRLSPEDRARMLDDENFRDYSEAQQIEITRARQELALRDPQLLDDVQYQALMVQRRRANSSAYSMMIENPEAAAAQLDSEIIGNNYKVDEVINRRRVEVMNDLIRKLEEAPSFKQGEFESILFNQLMKFGIKPGLYILKKLRDSKSNRIQRYSHIFDRAINTLQLQSDVKGFIDSMNLEESKRADFTDRVGKMIDKASSREEFIGKLIFESVSLATSQSDRDLFKKLYSNLMDLESLQDSTVDANQEGAKPDVNEATIAEGERKATEDAINDSKKNNSKSIGTKKARELGLLEEGQVVELIVNNTDDGNDGGKISPLQKKVTRAKIKNVLETKKDGESEEMRRVRMMEAVISKAHKTSINSAGLSFLYKLQEKVYSGEISVEDAMDVIDGMFHVEDTSNVDTSNNRTAEREAHGLSDKDTDTTKDEIAAREAAGISEQDTDKSRNEGEKQAAERAQFDLTPEDDIDKHKGITPEQIDKGVSEGEKVLFTDSPTIAEQARESAEVVPTVPIKDLTEGGNTKTFDDGSSLLGVAIYEYDSKDLRGGKQRRRTPNRKGDTLDKIFTWLDNEGIHLQDIVDNELPYLLKDNPKVYPMFVPSTPNAFGDDVLKDNPLLVIEYTPKMKRNGLHNEAFGGVYTVEGKQYLVIGMLGFNRGDSKGPVNINTILNQSGKYKYYQDHPGERFFVAKHMHTYVHSIMSGYRVKQLASDSEIEFRPVTELLKSPERNPKGLGIGDLRWAITKDGDFATVRVPDENEVYWPSAMEKDRGKTYLLIETANGNYIPSYVKSITLKSLKEGALKQRISNALMRLCSLDHNIREKAYRELRDLIGLTTLQKGNETTILFGTETSPTLTFIREGTTYPTIHLDSPDFIGAQALVDWVFDTFDPRVNVTAKALLDNSRVEELAEAGALNVDIAKLGTANASYQVYPIDKKGSPIIPEVKMPIKSEKSTEDRTTGTNNPIMTLPKAEGKQFYRSEDIWYEVNGEKVTDKKVIEQLELGLHTLNKHPDLIEKQFKFYVINGDRNNPKIISYNVRTQNYRELTKEESNRFFAHKEELDRKKRMEEAVKEELKKGNYENVDLDDNTKEDTPPKEDKKDIDLSHSKEWQEAEDTASRLRIDNTLINLDKESNNRFYKDQEGELLARVSDVKAGDKRGTKMPDNGYVLPSTTIGTGIHNFVEDVLFNRAGNPENYSQRYPNMTNDALKDLEKQVLELKSEIKRRGLTIIGTELTVDGEVKVEMPDKSIGVLRTAGTIDLLLHDEDGNFIIYDFKTKRGYITQRDKDQWALSQSLYKKFLQDKYGVKVDRLEIVPFALLDKTTEDKRYPKPKSEGGVAEYENRDGQLYMNGEAYTKIETRKLPNITLNSIDDINVLYDRLPEHVKPLVKGLPPLVDTSSNTKKETPSPKPRRTTGINETSDRSLSELQRGITLDTAANILRSRQYKKEVMDILIKKYKKLKGENATVPGTREALIDFIKDDLKMPIVDIPDVNRWIEMLKFCR